MKDCDKMPDWVKPGARFKKDYGPNNPNTRLYHVLAIVDDDMLVLKWWSKSKQRWFYQVKHLWFITKEMDRVVN